MSILIKGLEMPKTGELLCIDILPDGKVYIHLALKNKQIATAVPVPPHGRLIDADALDNTLGIEDRDDWVHWTLEAAPTIIPAEKEDANANER